MIGVEPLSPAYGRDYRTLREAQAHLDAGKDFVAANGQYIGLQELQRLGLREVRVRFARSTKTGLLKIPQHPLDTIGTT